MRKTLTAAAVQKIRPSADERRRRMDWDAIVPGLALRTTANASKSWVVVTRLRGRPIFVTLGKYPGLPLAKARELAREDLEAVQRGEDPREKRRAASERGSLVFENVARDFVERYVKKEKQLRTARELERMIEKRLVSRWKGRLVTEITKRDVLDLLDNLMDDGFGAGANRVLAAARKLFNWCVARDVIQASPCAGLAPPAPESRRERVLTNEEIKHVFAATRAENVSSSFGYFVRMLFATAQRRSEVARMRWQDINREGGAVWTIPSEFYKSERIQVVPLSSLAVEILDGVPRFDGCPWVFTTDGRSPISGFSKFKPKLDETLAKIARSADAKEAMAPWTFHDMRRTAASKMVELGVARFVVERVLGHADRTVTAIYDRHTYLPEKTAALEQWAEKLRQILATANLPSNTPRVRRHPRAAKSVNRGDRAFESSPGGVGILRSQSRGVQDKQNSLKRLENI